jgi:periplasmic divalent cation tolerance protein
VGVSAGVVLTTVGNREDAARLARRLVEEDLAACVQMLPIDSVYRWQGEVVEDAEILLLVKIAAGTYAEVEAAIAAGHPYKTPEILMLPVAAGLPAYLAWLGGERDAGGEGTSPAR